VPGELVARLSVKTARGDNEYVAFSATWSGVDNLRATADPLPVLGRLPSEGAISASGGTQRGR